MGRFSFFFRLNNAPWCRYTKSSSATCRWTRQLPHLGAIANNAAVNPGMRVTQGGVCVRGSYARERGRGPQRFCLSFQCFESPRIAPHSGCARFAFSSTRTPSPCKPASDLQGPCRIHRMKAHHTNAQSCLGAGKVTRTETAFVSR